MFSYPSILLLISFILFVMTGYFSSRLMYNIVPLVFSGMVLYLPFTWHFMNVSFFSYYLHLYLSYVYGKRLVVSPLIMLILFFGSRLLSRIVFGPPERKESQIFLPWR